MMMADDDDIDDEYVDEGDKSSPEVDAELTKFANDTMAVVHKYGLALSDIIDAGGGRDPGGTALMMMQRATTAVFWQFLKDLGYDVPPNVLKERFVDTWIEVAEAETSGNSVATFSKPS